MSSTATSSDSSSQQGQNGLWRHPSVMSSNSNLTSSSGNESYLSIDSLEKDNIQLLDQLSFITQKSDNYYQLIDDLAIIDEIYQTFDDESESEPYGNYLVSFFSSFLYVL
jgi:D-serine deaminase-like pyridoxal phosphate-dependent protein